jgi:hypothetical protein
MWFTEQTMTRFTGTLIGHFFERARVSDELENHNSRNTEKLRASCRLGVFPFVV